MIILPKRQRGGIMLATLALPQGVRYNLGDLASNYTDTGGATQTYGVEVIFRTDNTVDVLRDIAADLLDEQVGYVLPASQRASTYVRCLYVIGDTMTGGDAVDTWHLLSVQRSFIMRYTSSGGSDFIDGTFQFQLSGDGGTTIHETTGNVAITVGEIF